MAGRFKRIRHFTAILIASVGLAGHADALQADPLPSTADWNSVRAAVESREVMNLKTYRAMLRRQGEWTTEIGERLDLIEGLADEIRAPVLIPHVYLMAPAFNFVPGQVSYTVNVVQSEYFYAAQDQSCASGTSPADRAGARDVRARQRAVTRPRLPRLAVPYDVIQNSTGIEVDFTKFGCSYTLISYCSVAMNRHRFPCVSDPNFLKVIDAMVLFNPPPEQDP